MASKKSGGRKRSARKAARKKSAASRKRGARKKEAGKPAVRSEAYHGCQIEAETGHMAELVRIDGEVCEVQRDGYSGAYISPDLPYYRFGSAIELARALVDHRNEE